MVDKKVRICGQQIFFKLFVCILPREYDLVLRKTNVCHCVRFQFITAASIKMTVFWDVAPCSLVDVYRRFTGDCCLHVQGDV
jgi:hypothetical protein